VKVTGALATVPPKLDSARRVMRRFLLAAWTDDDLIERDPHTGAWTVNEQVYQVDAAEGGRTLLARARRLAHERTLGEGALRSVPRRS
jgi:hypothetical protein